MGTALDSESHSQEGSDVRMLTFGLQKSCQSRFGPRVGRIILAAPREECTTDIAIDGTSSVTLDTPNILVGTSRGVVPHLSRDHCNSADAIKWINVPFESFIEQSPPVPTLQTGPDPLHNFLGFDKRRHIVSLCLRDPMDTREMPPNGNAYVSALCVRGVRKVTPSDWRKYVYKLQPDVVFALSDTPFTAPPHSQKRVTKSIERSIAWLVDILRSLEYPVRPCSLPISGQPSQHPLNVFVNMAGGTSIPAREAFAHSLSEELYGPDLEAVKPIKRLDDGVVGYSFDLATLRGSIPKPLCLLRRTQVNNVLQQESPNMLQDAVKLIEIPTPENGDIHTPPPLPSRIAESAVLPDAASLLQASLKQLPDGKPRLVTGVRSPHEMLRLIRDVGVDIFDADLAIAAAHVGVALDFAFPLPPDLGPSEEGKKKDVGHNLYDQGYAHQYGRLSDCLAGAAESQSQFPTPLPICPCIACSPRSPTSHILHSKADVQSYEERDRSGKVVYNPPRSRGYLHHLLHTHEMSAHTMLVAHNLAVLDRFLFGVRDVLAGRRDGINKGEGEDGISRFTAEVNRFESVYDESMEVIHVARKCWHEVDLARGKGRLWREKEKQVLVEAEGVSGG
ncbi:hypothetical protein BKA82DRAFT_530571 [Pisolithus tinctorius]|uniref:tRNA-guanine(15) transglycosylase-like domain-containing protein n=1 Tax=Pisolithus tinctorius Marx 270 TaxID=870435 RepID=A0A0C3PAN8_PISTI|nr:hypothetical protein BKA82DRAFT_530571 [Pisolithus tinctorius]KIO04981.1 hypothetical protein M404DRAFT_530571 [Pisolithus tinctorius Marx 270]